MRKYLVLLVCIAILALSAWPSLALAVTTTAPAATQTELLSAAAKRLALLNNVAVAFIEDDDYTPVESPQTDALLKAMEADVKAKNPGTEFGPVMCGHRIFESLFSYLDGRARYENTMTPRTTAELESTIGDSFIDDIKIIQTFTPERIETLRYEPSEKFPIGSIQANAPLQWSTIDVALGLRVSGTSLEQAPLRSAGSRNRKV